MTKLARTAAKTVAKNSPAILTGLGIAGFCTTVVMTAKAAPAAGKVHEYHEGDRADIEYARTTTDMTKEQHRKEIASTYICEAKDLLPLYGPPVAVGVMSIACFIGANKINADRQAALLAAYSLSEKTLATYQQKVIEKLGEEEHEALLADATRDIVRSEVPEGYDKDSDPIPMNMVRVYDNVTGRYFYSSKERIMAAESAVNKRLISEMRVTLQEFYYELGLEERFNLGECMGWDVSWYTSGATSMNVFFAPMLDDEKNPCLAINYHVAIFERQS